MVITNRLKAAMIVVFGVSAVFGMQGQSRPTIDVQPGDQLLDQKAVIQEHWLNPDRRVAFSVNVPAAAAGVAAGGVATFINWATLRGNLWMMRRHMNGLKRNVCDFLVPCSDGQSVVGSEPSFKLDVSTFKKAIESDAACLARHQKISIVRRTMPFRAIVFWLPAYMMYHHVAQDEALRSTVCECLIKAQDELS